MSFTCSFTLSRRALTEFVTLCDGAPSKRGDGRLDLIFRCSCLKALTPSLPLTPIPCRSDDGCDKIEENPRAVRHAEKGRRARARQGQKQGCWCLVSGRTAPEMGLFHQEQAAAQGQQKS